MPHPAQVTRERIIHTAHALLETHGYEAVSLAKLAAELGIRAPSLYKHLADKNALIREVNTLTCQHLTRAIEDVQADTPYQQLTAMAETYRTYALAHPATYALAFDTVLPDAQPDPAVLEAMARPLQAVFARGVGEAASLAALRGAWALLHGFVVLEMGAQFRRAGAVEPAFRQAFDAYLRGWGIVP
jgi:AcrR family transcriptional regulator